jgi:hypothetical protein
MTLGESIADSMEYRCLAEMEAAASPQDECLGCRLGRRRSSWDIVALLSIPPSDRFLFAGGSSAI